MQKVSAIKFAQKIEKKEIQKILGKYYSLQRLPDVVIIQKENEPEQIAFLFDKGILVDWSGGSIRKIIKKNEKRLFLQLLDHSLDDSFTFTWSATEFDIQNDSITIPQDTNTLLAVSYAIARSIHLDFKEYKIAGVLEKIQHLPGRLSTTGTTGLSGKTIKKIIGSILELQYDMSSFGGINDSPELFWEKPELTTFYKKTALYLDLEERSDVTDQKLATLYHTLEILRDEVNTRKSYMLEWTIVLLIVLEIFLIVGEVLVKK